MRLPDSRLANQTKLALALMFVGGLAWLGTLGWQSYPKAMYAYRVKTCTVLSGIDNSVSGESQYLASLVGWVGDRTGVVRIDLVSGQHVLASARPDQERNDVLAVFPACSASSAKGFIMPLDARKLGSANQNLELRAIRSDGYNYRIGAVPSNLFPAISAFEEFSSLTWDGLNRISGWAFSWNSPVKVSVMLEKRVLASTKAKSLRDDVGKLFPNWSGAKHSAFDVTVRMVDLPRGRYPLAIRFDDGAGHVSTVRGPEVINDSPIGKVIGQADRLTNLSELRLEAWLADEDGIASARVETESGLVLGDMQRMASDVPISRLDDPRMNALPSKAIPLKSGDLFEVKLPRQQLPGGLSRVSVRVRDKSGNESLLSTGPLVLKENRPVITCGGRKLRVFYPGEVAFFRTGFVQMVDFQKMVQGGCVEVGIRARTEYLRTTLGRDKDFLFDPAFPDRLRDRGGDLTMTGGGLRELLATALRYKAPMLITLDGGVWADAKFSYPEVDVVDFLETDPATVQWNQFGRPEADDALEHLPGATKSPQLARMMSLNRYNRKFMGYKKRNLQAAIREIVQFMRKHPQIYIAVNLDPDQYINPWFYQTQWYDYNPDTLRQFREWLFHLEAYADDAEMASRRHEPKLTLAQVNQLAKNNWKTIAEVDPPRGTPNYQDPWQQIWTQFKRHLVARHYDDLAEWATQAGLPEDRIFTSQTFIQTDVASKVNDPATGWTDQAGVSIEGAKPRKGRLGAILYGPASRNEGTPRSGRSLIQNIRDADPEWGVVEFHPASFALPDKLPTHAESYSTLLNLINGGAHFLSPMWGSYAGDRTVHPEHFKAYDAMEGSAFEYQFVWWLREMRAFPVGNLFYPFGNAQVKSSDGWLAGKGAMIELQPGHVTLSGRGRQLSLVSPVLDKQALSGSQLEVRGSWSGHSVPELRLYYFDGGSENIRPARASSGSATFRFGSQRGLKMIGLEWGNHPHKISAHEVISIDQILVATR
ncbi:MAG: hypothetical protein Q8O37_00240 [Sulfuricellaceae bacterium]|nr:hypothetical protein [Sulfuricellaceae bacterium]